MKKLRAETIDFSRIQPGEKLDKKQLAEIFGSSRPMSSYRQLILNRGISCSVSGQYIRIHRSIEASNYHTSLALRGLKQSDNNTVRVAAVNAENLSAKEQRQHENNWMKLAQSRSRRLPLHPTTNLIEEKSHGQEDCD